MGASSHPGRLRPVLAVAPFLPPGGGQGRREWNQRREDREGHVSFLASGDHGLVVGLTLRDCCRNVARIEMALGGDGPTVSLYNAEGARRILLALAGDEVGLTLTDARGQSLLLGLDEKSVTLRLADGRGQYVRIGVAETGIVVESDGAGREGWLERLVGGGE